MNHLKYYHNHLEKYQTEAKNLYKKMTGISTLRLFIFLVTGFGIYFFFSQWKIAVSIGVFGVVIFIYLLSKYTDIKKRREFNKALVVIIMMRLKLHLVIFTIEMKVFSFKILVTFTA